MSVEIYKVKEIPIKLHSSFLIILAIFSLFSFYNGGVAAAAQTLLLFLMLFGSVLLHELGHALVAEKNGITTKNITLYPFGGIAYINNLPDDENIEIYVAIAGPVVNFIITAISIPLIILGVPLAFELAFINIVMGVFNLFPAFPMDGGRILRALLSKKIGRRKATEKSLLVSNVSAVLFFAMGVYTGWISLIVVSVFLLIAAKAERTRLEKII